MINFDLTTSKILTQREEVLEEDPPLEVKKASDNE
jgi:hypothetical protein